MTLATHLRGLYVPRTASKWHVSARAIALAFSLGVAFTACGSRSDLPLRPSGRASGGSGGGTGASGGRAGSSGTSGTGGTGACVPGEVEECVCDDGTSGLRGCRDDGSGFGRCRCQGGVGGTGGSSGCVPPVCSCPSCFETCVCQGVDSATCASSCNGSGGCGTFDECLGQVGSANPECAVCACDNCLCELADCRLDPGCTEIRGCVEKTGCLGIDCYQPGTCQGVIDAWGSPTGPSAALAVAVSNCMLNNACPCTGCRCQGAIVTCFNRTMDCTPYRCTDTGSCLGFCNSDADCAPGFRCRQNACT